MYIPIKTHSIPRRNKNSNKELRSWLPWQPVRRENQLSTGMRPMMMRKMRMPQQCHRPGIPKEPSVRTFHHGPEMSRSIWYDLQSHTRRRNIDLHPQVVLQTREVEAHNGRLDAQVKSIICEWVEPCTKSDLA